MIRLWKQYYKPYRMDHKKWRQRLLRKFFKSHYHSLIACRIQLQTLKMFVTIEYTRNKWNQTTYSKKKSWIGLNVAIQHRQWTLHLLSVLTLMASNRSPRSSLTQVNWPGPWGRLDWDLFLAGNVALFDFLKVFWLLYLLSCEHAGWGRRREEVAGLDEKTCCSSEI